MATNENWFSIELLEHANGKLSEAYYNISQDTTRHGYKTKYMREISAIQTQILHIAEELKEKGQPND